MGVHQNQTNKEREKEVFKMMRIEKIILVLVGIFMLSFSVSAVVTNPSGATSVEERSTETFNGSLWSAASHEASAGNVTEINITGISQTKSWQGYYGEVTGTITLDDANNNTMYDWSSAEPQGEIYASNASIVIWDDIQCFNYDADGDTEINITGVEAMFGIASDDYDGIDITFHSNGKLSDHATDHPEFYVGSRTITPASCPATSTYINSASAAGSTDFTEVLLTDKLSIVFTTIIQNDDFGNVTDKEGFDGNTHDFQMLVAENGNDGDDTTTPYYFFVELE